MRMLLIPSLTLLLAAPLLAQEHESRAILQKAVRAHGGPKVLGKFAASHSRTKGRYHVLGGLDVASEEDMQFPAKYKSVGDMACVGIVGGLAFRTQAAAEPPFVGEKPSRKKVPRLAAMVRLMKST